MIIAAQNTTKRLTGFRNVLWINTLALFPGDALITEVLGDFRINPRSPLYLTEITTGMTKLKEGLEILRNAFENYGNVFSDKKVIIVIDKLIEDLREGTSFIQDNLRQSRRTREIQLHLHSLLRKFSGDFSDLETRLKDFISEGLPLISSMLQDRDDRYLKMTTIATFFPAVTVTILQQTYASNGNTIQLVTNVLLLSSIVFSVTSAVSSFMAMAWNRSVVRQSEKVLSVFFNAWLQKWPTFSLMISGLLFSAGICCFAVSSSQGRVSQVLMFVFVVVNCMIFVYMAIRLIQEEKAVRHDPGGAGAEITHGLLTLDIIDGLWNVIRHAFHRNRGKRNGTDVFVEDSGSHHNGDTRVHQNHKHSAEYKSNEDTQVLPPFHLDYTQIDVAATQPAGQKDNGSASASSPEPVNSPSMQSAINPAPSTILPAPPNSPSEPGERHTHVLPFRHVFYTHADPPETPISRRGSTRANPTRRPSSPREYPALSDSSPAPSSGQPVTSNNSPEPKEFVHMLPFRHVEYIQADPSVPSGR
ncbi:hypothetical protein M0805_003638 [Coniferiporia weirii]|nr:hypothetical protein M0805_003638 [Coniferiporia weirii]